MKYTLPHIISFLLHPSWMPLLTFALIFLYGGTLIPIEANGVWLLLAIIFMFTFVLPGMSLLMLRQWGYIKSIYMENREDRKLPFAITTGYYTLLVFLLIQKVSFSEVLIVVMLGITLAVACTTVITLYYQVSAHTVGTSGAFGVFVGLAFQYNELHLITPTLLLCLFSGVVMSARLAMQVHRPGEVYTGFLVGFGTTLATIIILL